MHSLTLFLSALDPVQGRENLFVLSCCMRQEILQAAVMGVAAFCLFGARVFTVIILMGKVAKKSTLVTESGIALVLLGTVLVVPPAEVLH